MVKRFNSIFLSLLFILNLHIQSIFGILELLTIGNEAELHPCGSNDNLDIECVRKVISSLSGNPVSTSTDNLDPATIPGTYSVLLPTPVIKNFKTDNVFTGLSQSRVLDLKLDFTSDYTVLLVQHPAIQQRSQVTTTVYSRANAPFNVSATFFATYNNVYTTTTFVGTKQIYLGQGTTLVQFEGDYDVNFQPAGDCVDPIATRRFNEVNQDLQLFVLEESALNGVLFVNVFIDQRICKFLNY